MTYTQPMRIIAPLTLLCFSSTAFAVETEANNIFNADVSNPDLALAVSQFEETCMPFVLHKTKLTRNMDNRHQSEHMKNQGYVIKSYETLSRRVQLAPPRYEWKPQNPQPKLRDLGHFTVFSDISHQVVIANETVLGRSGETDLRPIHPALYKTVTVPRENYIMKDQPKLTATLDWNYPSQNHPAKSCEVKLETPNISKADFSADFIQKDRDWKQKDSAWSQCVSDGDDEFEFTVKHGTNELSLHVTRNDFYETKICQKTSNASP